jgi:hypothetical protein
MKTLQKQRACWHPEASARCSGAAIRAHSVQRQGPLRRLVDERNRVRCFFPPERDAFGQLVAHPVGWNEASTFLGFCAHHDQELFRPIDTQPYTCEPKQTALVAFRSICHELHKKKAAQAAMRRNGLKALRGRSVAERTFLDEHLSGSYWATESGIAEIGQMKTFYDRALASSDFTSLRSCVVFFEGELSVASSGVVAPDFDLEGQRLQRILDPGMQSLVLGTVLTERGAAVVFSWPQAFERMTRFVASLTGLPREAIPTALVLFMFSYVENTFFSAEWWASLVPAKQTRLAEAAAGIQYGTAVNYRAGRLVPWSVTGIVDALPAERTA